MTLLAAHRGGAHLWPENSLAAFGGALALGVDFLELDVHLTRDGAAVVIHDPILDRTTTGTGPVAGRALADLRGVRLRDREGRVTGEGVPTLDAVLALSAPTAVRLLVEIKTDAREAPYPGIEEAVLGALDRHGLTGRAVVMAFEPDAIHRVRRLAPALAVGALYSPRALRRLGATVATALAGCGEAGLAFVGLHQSLVSPDTVELARRGRLTLGVWTVNAVPAMKRFIEMGVGVLITDRPDLAKALLHP